MKNVFVPLICGLILLVSQPVLANNLREIFEQGEKQYKSGQYQEAIKTFNRTLKIYPRFAPSYNYLGLCHKAIGSKTKEIISYFEKAIEVDPKYVQAYDNLSKIHYILGDFEKAATLGNKALEINPNLVSIKLSLGWVYLIGLDKPKEAIDYFEGVLKTHNIPYAFFGLGIAYFKNEQRFKVFDMVTNLRKANEEGLARELENMLRDGKYQLSGVHSPIVMPKRQRGTLVGDPVNISSTSGSGSKKKMPVRLRSTPADNSSSTPDGFSIRSQRPTAADRIRRYQQNNQAKGSSY